MKLKTVLREDNGRAFADYNDGSDVDHDALAAHALVRALAWFEETYPVDAAIITRRAAGLMREWGFGEGEG